MMLQVLVIVLLCSTYCSAQSVNSTQTVDDDKTNWEEIFKVMNASGTARTDEDNLDVFDTILRVNARERGTGLGRSDTDVFLFEGDIVINKREITGSGYPNTTRKKRAVIRNTGRNLWDKTIYYVLDSSLGGKAKSAIATAIKEWSDTLPCITWADVTRYSKPSSYMHFFVGGGCYSQVGRVGGGQKVSIGRGCEYHGIAVHEIGHAMGLWHEQSRPDRDQYVRIIWNNIIPATRFNFQKQPASRVDSLGVEYDYDSVMHYGATAFAKARGLLTIQSLKGGANRRLGQRKGLSANDKKQVKLLYKCGTTASTPPPTTVKPTWPTVCTDSSSHRQWCIESKKLLLCNNALFKGYMTRYCCNTCKPTPPPTTPTTAKPTGCQDKVSESWCKGWREKGYCNKDNQYYDYMKANCCKTCYSVTCVDKGSNCAFFQSRRYCTQQYVDYMKENCVKTCGYC